MAVVVGRIEYLVGADGRLLQKETRDVARKAGQSGGKVYSDEFTEAFRKKWGSSSGFASVLGKGDQKILRQFQQTGGFASKAFADRFERVLVPKYRKVADKMVAAFEGLRFDPLNGITAELQRIFGKAEDVEGSMRRVKGVLDELEATSRMGIIDRKSFDIAAVNRLRDALQEVFDTGNWEMLSQSQRRIRDEMWAQAEAGEEIAAQLARRAELVDRQNTLEKQLSHEYGRQLTVIERMLIDRNALSELSEDEQVALLSQALRLDEIKRKNQEIAALERDRFDFLARQAEHFDNVFQLPGGTLSNDFERLAAQVAAANAEMDGTHSHFVRLGAASKKLGPILLKPWTNLDKDVRLVIGLIASAADQVAVLGSAAGAGLLALGSAATTALGGAVGFGVIISRLNDDIEELPPGLQAAAFALGGFTDSFGRLRDELVGAAALDMVAGFTLLERSLDQLTPATREFGGAVGSVFADFAAAVRPGSAALEEIEELIRNSADLLPELAAATGVWGEGLLRGMNRAKPLAEDLLDWIEELGARFNDFTRDDAFGEWVSNAQRIFGELGGLLDQIGRSLNNLATPGAVDRTAELLQNLTRFVPALEGALDVLGRFDLVGIVVKAFAELGEAFAPLQDELGVLADTLRTGVFAALEGLAAVLGVTTKALEPFVGVLVAVVQAVPPEVWSALAGAAALYFTVLSGFRALTVISGILTGISDAAIGLFNSLTSPKVNAATGAVNKLSDGFRKAGLAGAIAGAGVAIGLFVSDALRDFSKIESKMTEVVAVSGGIEGALEAVQSSFWTGTGTITDYGAAFTELKQKQDNFLSGSDALWNQNQRNADTLQQTFHELDAPLAALAQKSLPAAQKQFQQMAEDMGLTDAQVQVMLDEMPQLEAVFADAAGGTKGLATEQETLAFALSEVDASAAGVGGSVEELTPEMQKLAENTQLAADALEVLKGRSVEALEGIEGVADGIKTLGSAYREQESANVGYHQSIEDVRLALEENGKVWDITTQAGRDNRLAIMDLAQSTLDYASEIYNMTGSQEDAAAAIQAGKDAVIQAVEGMDLGGLSAEEYATKLGLIPGDVSTLVSANTAAGMEMADAFATRLYELGLLEVNPVIAADNAAALAAAEEARAAMTDLEKEQFDAIIAANNGPAIAAAAEAMATMTNLEQEQFISTLDADNNPALVAAAEAMTTMTDLELETFTPTIDANNQPAKEKTKQSYEALNLLDFSTFTPDLNVNNKQALDGTAAVQSALNNVKSKTVTLTVNQSVNISRQWIDSGRELGWGLAAGGIATKPTVSLWGEAGPEAIVPLNRPLSQVDPSVRALSAFAQGLSPAGRMAGTGAAGGRSFTIEPGAIVVQGNLQPEATATTVVNRIAERIGA